MTSGEAFLGGIIDYAGLFPPAQLPLGQTLHNYVAYRNGKDAWLLGRFVCPAARLGELAAAGPEFFQGPAAWRIAALGRGGKDAQDYFAGVKADLADIARLGAALGDKVSVETYEVRLPESAFNPLRNNQLSSLIATTAYLLETSGPPLVTPFFEAPVTERASLLAVIQALHDDQYSSEARARRRCRPAGFKLRTGGLEAAAFPSAEQVALAVAACASAAVPFKATAGLHHPFRHVDAAVGATMHGFVNVFAAGCLAVTRGLAEANVRALVEAEDPTHFQLGPEGLRWRDLSATAEQLARGRTLFTSFGSCSFDEPVEDLRRLQWIPQASARA